MARQYLQILIGFAWGYEGSGPEQLALALLVNALQDSEFALAHYQDFKRAIVAKWPGSWTITGEEIRALVLSRVAGNVDSFAE